jgi:hypothetical protein
MNRKIFETATLAMAMVTMWLLPGVYGAQAQDAASPYPAMAPLGQYLMANRVVEIALAKSAAPAAISNGATVLILAKDGYQTAIEGKNGFTCLVERSWMSPFDSPEFWNPTMRGPICYNPPATRSILPYTINRTRLVLAGLSKAQIKAQIQSAVASKQLSSPEPGAMSYMLSKGGYLGDSVKHWHPHLMFHVPTTDAASWGADLPGSPVLLDTEFPTGPEPETIFMIPVDNWSDGTPDAAGPSAMHG